MWKCILHPSFELNVPIVGILPQQGDNGECQVGY
jgi:hypothetical protein